MDTFACLSRQTAPCSAGAHHVRESSSVLLQGDDATRRILSSKRIPREYMVLSFLVEDTYPSESSMQSEGWDRHAAYIAFVRYVKRPNSHDAEPWCGLQLGRNAGSTFQVSRGKATCNNLPVGTHFCRPRRWRLNETTILITDAVHTYDN